ncbi:hypothetical protein CAC42_8132 [Sphaceloma murrayae]|uniref:Uncharacterized protein n=1 Tax=Sphaceloma murrayae TaxID=2082308 RepID=A0A2K1QRI9_9PEZI|nr:hypothetical protein CAC42_8132 [Sphaceloma murrayae]
MQSEGNEAASPHPRTRRQNNRQHHQNNRGQEVFSDSNMPTNATPKSRKAPRNNTPGERSASAAIPQSKAPNTSNQHKARPVSIAAANGKLAVTPSKASYAGAAFNASPAPSSLPVPKFFSKSVPPATANSGLQARVEREGDKSDSNDCHSGSSLSPSVARSHMKSPLDMFFNADRQEKARTGSAGATQTGNAFSQCRSETPSKPRDMFMLELDGTSSPAGSNAATPPLTRPTPSTERARTAPNNVPTLQNSEDTRRAQQTQSLKSFLNLTAAESPSNSPFLSTPQNQHTATPSQTPQQDPNLLYGNRNLSPLFHAARSPGAQPSPPHHSFNAASPQPSVSNYGNMYGNHFGSPSRPVHGSPHQQNHHMYQPQFQAGLGGQQQHSSNGTPYGHPATNAGPSEDVRAMEEKMRRMLKMG